jgi:SAM-dependent methyltransferase
LEWEGWERAAPLYEDAWSGLTRQFVAPLLDLVRIGAGQRVVDIACGPGYVAQEAARRGAEVVGIDFAPAMVRVATARCPGLCFQRGDAECLEAPDRSYDAALINFGLMHFARPPRALAEARRVLRAGGWLGFTVWADPERSPGARAVEQAVAAFAEVPADLPAGPPAHPLRDAADCRELLAPLGFAAADLRFVTVRGWWRVASPDGVFETELRAGVRTAALLRRQSPERLAAIRAAMTEGVSRFAVDGGYALPMTAYVVAARRQG